MVPLINTAIINSHSEAFILGSMMWCASVQQITNLLRENRASQTELWAYICMLAMHKM